jgi:ApaG protein
LNAGNFIELPGLHVTVDKVRFNPFASAPADRPYCFVYFITIHNDSNTGVTIKGRKWVVTNQHGEITAVEADGVVGQFPHLSPGEKFTYNSFHLLETPRGVAEGSYLGLDENGGRVVVRIPKFDLVAPKSL